MSFHDLIAHLFLSEMLVKVTQSCLTLCDPMNYRAPGILQARILEGVAFPFSRGSSQHRDWTSSALRILYQLTHKGSPRILELVAYPFSSGSSWSRDQTGISCLAGGFFTDWAMLSNNIPLFVNTTVYPLIYWRKSWCLPNFGNYK